MKYLKIILFFLLSPVLPLRAQENLGTSGLSPEKRQKFIDKAAELRKGENYNGAIVQVDSILAKNPKDAQMLLFKGDLLLQSKRYTDAAANLKILIPLNYQRTIAQINLSYAEFMAHKTTTALKDATTAWKENPKDNGATVNHFNALLWNIKVKEATAFFEKNKDLLKEDQKLVLLARLYTTSGNYKKGLEYYSKLVKAYPNKYYIQEYSEVLLGKKEYTQSMQTMKAHDTLYTKSEYKQFTDKYTALKVQYLGTEFSYFRDIGNNTRVTNSVFWVERDGHPYRFGLRAGVSEYYSPNGNLTGTRYQTSNSQFAHLDISERWNMAWSGTTALDLQHINPAGLPQFTGLTGKQVIQYQPDDHHMVALFTSSNYIDWTAQILSKEIRVTSFGYMTHILLTGHDGFYSQGSYGILSDSAKNTSLQFFGSLYHLFRTEPTLKVGLNLSVVHYSQPHDPSLNSASSSQYVATLDYAPNLYKSVELFADYSTALAGSSKFYLKLQGGAGLQKQDAQSVSANYRAMVELGMHLKHWDTYLRYQTSNAAATTGGVGYKFDWVTYGLIYKW